MDSTQAKEPEAAPAKETWRDKLQRHWMQTRLAHEGMMLDKIRTQNKIVQDNVKKMADQPVSDDMGDVNIGNETHNHYDSQQTTTSAPAPPAPPAQQAPPQAGNSAPVGMSPLAKGLLGAALLAGGAGLGYMAADGGDTFTDTDTDTTYSYSGGLGAPPQ